LLERSDVYGGGTSADADGLHGFDLPQLFEISVDLGVNSFFEVLLASLNHSAEYVSPIVGIWLLTTRPGRSCVCLLSRMSRRAGGAAHRDEHGKADGANRPELKL
jgi:hypothetical protein